MIQVANLSEKFSKFSDQLNPRIVGEVNDMHVKVTKFQGTFIWHQHEREDEMFLVVKGVLRIKVREGGGERELTIRPGEFVIIPRGVEHNPVADEEVHIVLFEPKGTLNTGNVRNEVTKEHLQWI
jgi:mannose-6-phosphate isomerase-like protein (cupin superfamily)